MKEGIRAMALDAAFSSLARAKAKKTTTKIEQMRVFLMMKVKQDLCDLILYL